MERVERNNVSDFFWCFKSGICVGMTSSGSFDRSNAIFIKSSLRSTTYRLQLKDKIHKIP
jgi:hypothetical protein